MVQFNTFYGLADFFDVLQYVLEKGFSPFFVEDVQRILDIRDLLHDSIKRRYYILDAGLFLLQFMEPLRRRPRRLEGEFGVELLYFILKGQYIKDNL